MIETASQTENVDVQLRKVLIMFFFFIIQFTL